MQKLLQRGELMVLECYWIEDSSDAVWLLHLPSQEPAGERARSGAALQASLILYGKGQKIWIITEVAGPARCFYPQSTDRKECSLDDSSVYDRFWAKVHKTDRCWIWIGSRDSRGEYGSCWNGKRVVRAHCFVWELEHGPVPEGMQVLQRCDNKMCVRPKHLYLGTSTDNTAQ